MYEVKSPSQQPDISTMETGNQTSHPKLTSFTAKREEFMATQCLNDKEVDQGSSDFEDDTLTVDLCSNGPPTEDLQKGGDVIINIINGGDRTIVERQTKTVETDSCVSAMRSASLNQVGEEEEPVDVESDDSEAENGDRYETTPEMIDRQKFSVGGANSDATVLSGDGTKAAPTETDGGCGAIQIKNWRPLTFDTITDDPDATLEDILGELSSIATLRIRICSQLQHFAMEDIKDKLLQFLLLHSQAILTSSGCPLEKNLLLQISQGESPKSLPEDTQEAFSTWFKEKVQKGITLSNNNNNDVTKVPESSTKATGENQSHPVSSSPDQPQQLSPNLPQGTGVPQYNNHSLGNFVPAKYPLNFSSHQARPRARTSFDPEHEVPRLQKWFDVNQHPSRDQMCLYMNELNSLPSRQGRRPLDLTNIIYWFKNARAANRRAMLANKGMDLTGYMDSSFGDSSIGDENEEVVDCFDDADSNTSTENHGMPVDRDVPDLPNKNAVYVVSPMLPQSPRKASPVVIEPLKVPDYDKDDHRPRDFSIPKLISREKHMDNHRLSSQHSISNLFNGNKENQVISNPDDQPADLSLPKKRKLSVDDDMDRIVDSRSKASKLSIKTEADMEEGYGSSNTSSPSPSPKSLNSSSSSISSSHIGGFPNMTHQALQMAAMSHALNMHYMHPAAMYASPLIPPTPPSFMARSNNTSPRPTPSPQATTNSNTSPSLMSEQERKKRSRVFIDPLTEIPKLEKWFIEDTHPSSYMIEKYTEELNMSPYRQRFPKLEPKNVQLWFKNHRAKVKRARQEQAALSQINHSNAISS